MIDRFARLFLTPDSAAPPLFDESFSRGSISEQVANRVLALVKSGTIRPGDRFPTESQMTVALGISRPPLREALKALTLMGVLESRQGGRYTVTDLSPLRLVEPFNIMLSGRRYDPKDHFEARSVVELECVRLCAARAGPERRIEISRLAEAGPSSIGNVQAFRVIDQQFHGAIYVGSGNPMLEAMARGLFGIALDIRRSTSVLPSLIVRSCEDHASIAKAIAAGDGDGAVEAYRCHLVHIRDATIRVLAAAPCPNAPGATQSSCP